MLNDVLTYNLLVVFCGTAKGKASAQKGFYYAGPGNKFYGILYEAGFTPHKLIPSECYTISQFRIGLTDLVHKEYGNDNELHDENYEIELFNDKIKTFKPKYVAFTSKKAASYALGYMGKTNNINFGLHTKLIGHTKVFILPSTSGNARKYWDSSWWHLLSKSIKNS